MKYIYRIFLVFLVLSSQTLVGQHLEAEVNPEDLGFSSDRLVLTTDRLQQLFDKCGTPGAHALVVKNGQVVYDETFGYQDKLRSLAMSDSAIFRIYSMSKPITSVATMILWEKGFIKLDEPIFLYLPEFKDTQVANVDEAGNVIARDAASPITIMDLLRHTSGITYGSSRGVSPVRDAWRQVRLDNFTSLEDFSKHVAAIPLVADPGSHWDYGYSTDILGRLIEVVSGQSFSNFIKENITTPLKMKDTDFVVPSDKVARLAQGYDTTTLYYPNNLWDATKRRNIDSGGGGMVSTMHDYSIFCQMLLNKGVHNNVRILGRKTVNLMTSNQLMENIVGQDEYYSPQVGFGFGLGFAVRLNEGIAFAAGSAGDYGWGGAAGTGFWIDPEEDLICILMVQHMGSSYYLRDRFKALVYQAIK